MRDEHILEPMLDVVYRQIVVALEADEVVLVALVVAHEYVLAMHAPVVVPPALGFLNRLAFRVIVGREGDVMFAQIAQHALLTFGYYLVVIHHKDSKNQNLVRHPQGRNEQSALNAGILSPTCNIALLFYNSVQRYKKFLTFASDSA